MNPSTSREERRLEPFLATLCARLEGDVSGEAYARDRQEALRHLDELEKPPRIRDEEQYSGAREVKSLLASLSCFTFNTGHPENDRVWRLEALWGRALARYNRRYLIRDHETRAIARYLLWSRYWPGVDSLQVFDEAKRRGILRKGKATGLGTPSDHLYVVGLEMKVGDNTFTVDHYGRHYRHHHRTCARQAFHVEQALDRAGIAAAASWFADVPELGAAWTETAIGDSKFAARPVHLTRRERATVLHLFHPNYRESPRGGP